MSRSLLGGCSNSGSSSSSGGGRGGSDGGPILAADVMRQKREFGYENDAINLSSKKPRTQVSVHEINSGLSSQDRRLVVVDAVPLAVVKPEEATEFTSENGAPIRRCCRQFWKAGDYEGDSVSDSALCPVGIDHLRVHPKFLHSNATSHKWALGALAELLDNSLDEVCNGATYVHVDSTVNEKDKKSNMLIVEDNGGGMRPDRIRQCMSLGYSAKSKRANTIGQYGNGFKTSTMRLGADVIVFSRCQGKDGKRPTQSVGMLSYTFLRSTRKEDIVVPMVDFQKVGNDWKKIIRSNVDDWRTNLDTISKWSPYLNESDLLKQFNFLEKQGTRIVIYNLWEDDQGSLELDFDTDSYDIQLRGVNRDEKNIEMAEKYPNSRHFLTYRHSLRSYASILYLRLPLRFRIILRGKDVKHHSLVNDMMLVEEMTYKPLQTSDGSLNQNMVASVKLGFVKDAHHHVDIQGFNVYHRNRLIKPFWRVWNAAGSDGRGVIGVLEANFVEPAHDKQGFERTTPLSRLENRLVKYQKSYWASKCHEIGYAPRRSMKKSETSDKESTPPAKQKNNRCQDQKTNVSVSRTSKTNESEKSERRSPVDEDMNCGKESSASAEAKKCPESNGRSQKFRSPFVKDAPKEHPVESSGENLFRWIMGDEDPTKRLNETRPSTDLSYELQRERDRSELFESQLKEAKAKIEEMEKEHIALVDLFQEETTQWNTTEEGLRRKIREASDTIADLVKKVKELEARVARNHITGE